MTLQEKWAPKEGEEDRLRAALSLFRGLDGYLPAELSGARRWHLIEGACLVLLGLTCFWAASMPVLDSKPNELLLIFAGAVMLLPAMRADPSPGFAFSLAQALIPLAAALCLIGTPQDGAANPGAVFAAYFAASGIAAVLLAAAHRRRLSPQWEWMAVSGVTSLILALLILSGLPGPFTWMFGILLGVAFLFEGSARLALAFG